MVFIFILQNTVTRKLNFAEEILKIQTWNFFHANIYQNLRQVAAINVIFYSLKYGSYQFCQTSSICLQEGDYVINWTLESVHTFTVLFNIFKTMTEKKDKGNRVHIEEKF